MTKESKTYNRPTVRTQWDRQRLQIGDLGPTRTKQEFKDECDINNILRQYVTTGTFTHINRRQPQYGYVDGHDFMDAMRIVTEGQNMFADLPSHIRKRFGNDPAEFLAFVQNPDNAAEMASMGLREAPAPEPAPMEPAPKELSTGSEEA